MFPVGCAAPVKRGRPYRAGNHGSADNPWAKAHGYHTYDFEGIEIEAAKMVLNNEPLPDSLKQTVTSYKLGFGGQVKLFPQAYDHVYSPFLRWGYDTVFPRIASMAVTKTAMTNSNFRFQIFRAEQALMKTAAVFIGNRTMTRPVNTH